MSQTRQIPGAASRSPAWAYNARSNRLDRSEGEPDDDQLPVSLALPVSALAGSSFAFSSTPAAALNISSVSSTNETGAPSDRA